MSTNSKHFNLETAPQGFDPDTIGAAQPDVIAWAHEALQLHQEGKLKPCHLANLTRAIISDRSTQYRAGKVAGWQMAFNKVKQMLGEHIGGAHGKNGGGNNGTL